MVEMLSQRHFALAGLQICERHGDSLTFPIFFGMKVVQFEKNTITTKVLTKDICIVIVHLYC